MHYFKNVLPPKKENISKIYAEILYYLKKVKKAVKSDNVEDVRWWFGYIFTIMCENQEYIDPIIYKSIIELKDDLYNSISKILFFHNTFKNAKNLLMQIDEILRYFDQRLAETKLYLQIIENL